MAIDDTRVRSRTALLEHVRRHPAGTVHRYALEHDGGRTTRDVTSMTFTWGDWATTFGAYTVNGMVFVLVGLAVFWLKPDAGPSRAVLAFGVIWGAMLLLCLDLFTAGHLDAVYFVIQGLCPPAVLHLAFAFPERRRIVEGRSWPLAATYAVGALAGLTEVFLYRRSPAALLRLDAAVWLTLTIAGALSMVGTADAAVRGSSPVARRRARVVLTGALAAFLLPLVAVLAFFLLGRPVSASVLASTGVLFPLAIGYAVVRHDLFEADRVVKLALTYATVTALVSLLYAFLVLGAERVTAGVIDTTSPLFPIGFVMLVVATIVPLRDRVQRTVDRLFYRGRVDYKATIAHANERLTTLLDRPAIVREVTALVRERLFLSVADVWFPTAGPDDGGGRRLLELGRALSRDELRESLRFRDERAALTAFFDRHGVDLVLPLEHASTPMGLLVVGPKASGAPLSADDVDVLHTLARETASALATAHAVEALEATRADLALAERLAAIGELSAAVAHGIRNPLAGIRLAAQLGLEDVPSDAPVRENLGDILVEVQKLEDRIRGVLDFARPFEPTLAAIDVRTIASSVLATAAPTAAERGVATRLVADDDAPCVRADPAHLGQALQEIVVDCVEATPRGGTVTITVHTGHVMGHVTIEITDTGPGVPPELRERVFQLFMTTKATGTGVGLAVARKIVERHGGTLTLDANEPRGARFIMTLPVAAQGPVI